MPTGVSDIDSNYDADGNLKVNIIAGSAAGPLATSAKGATAAGNPTSVNTDANTQALHAHVVNFPATQPVSGPLTDAQLRAAVVPVSLTSTTVTGTVAVTDNAGSLTVDSPQLPAALAAGGGLKIEGVAAGVAVPVSGTFWQAAQPITDNAGSLTVDAPVGTPVFVRLSDGAAAIATLPVSLATNTPDVTDRAARLLGSIANTSFGATLAAETTKVIGTVNQGTSPWVTNDPGLPNTLGQQTMAASTGVVLASDHSTINVAMAAASVLFRGRASTFRTPGRAGTVGQKILSLHNATGSTIKVYVTKVVVDLVSTVVKAITVLPPVIRLWKVTVLPTNGTALAKTKIGGTTTSSASVTVLGDASADGTGSATTLTATLPAGAILTQEYAPRFITAAGYEPADRIEYELGGEIELLALEGVVLFVDYVLATQNPTTDMWIAGLEWYEKA